MRSNASIVLTMILASFMMDGMAVAQPRPAAGARPLVPTARPASSAASVTIKSIHGIRSQDKVRTPEYTTSARETSQTKYWGCITVEYETVEDWTDALEFKYYVLVQNPKTKVYQLFTKTINYIDIAKGKHFSTVFLRHNTLERHGAIERAAVEINAGGQRAASASVPEDAQAWWVMAISTGKIRVDDNVLMDRSETPFAFVAYDNYETIKKAK